MTVAELIDEKNEPIVFEGPKVQEFVSMLEKTCSALFPGRTIEETRECAHVRHAIRILGYPVNFVPVPPPKGIQREPIGRLCGRNWEAEFRR